jgi:hypothetical protein
VSVHLTKNDPSLIPARPNDGMTRILRFPTPPAAPTTGARWIDRWRGRCREAVGRLLRRLRVPGVIRACELTDAVTGQHVAVNVGTLYVRVTVDGRDYYFDRFTGRFDGTGMGCR